MYRGALLALLTAACGNAWTSPSMRLSRIGRPGGLGVRAPPLRNTANEDAEKLAAEAAALRAEIAALEGPDAPAPAPSPAAPPALSPEEIERIEKERRGGISKDMQKKLLREMQSQGADPNKSAGNPILLISAVIAVLAIAVNLF